MEPSQASLNPLHKRHLLATFEHVDKLLGDIECTLTSSSSNSPFQKYIDDTQLAERKVILDYIARFRSQVLRATESESIDISEPRFSTLHSIRTTLAFVDTAIEELRPKYLKGYGEVPPEAAQKLEGLVEELQSIIEHFRVYLDRDPAQDLEQRLANFAQYANIDAGLLRELSRIIGDRGFVEFRPRLASIINRLEEKRFEIALFGRVSSGKSSLLNAIIGADILPVGVTPITSIPTRIIYGKEAEVMVWFSNHRPQKYQLPQLPEFVTEQHNPGNHKYITRVVVTLPSERLKEGVVFVDTPGLGSLATSGAAETIAYLPQCDAGIVLIDAAATITDEDIATLRTLHAAGIEAHILLSKADLLSESDQNELIRYITQQVYSNLGFRIDVHSISSKSSHRQLLEHWIVREVQPLFERHAERLRESLWKKTLVLKQTIEASLRVRTERLGQSVNIADVITESAVRNASGEIVLQRREHRNLSDMFAESKDRLLENVAGNLATQLTSHTAEVDLAEYLEAEVIKSAQAIKDQLLMLAHTLSEALASAAARLELPLPASDELAGCIREMPRFDSPHAVLRLNHGIGLFGPRWAAKRIASQLDKRIGEEFTKALVAYGRRMETWALHTIAALEHQFETHADVYRVQLGAMRTEHHATPDEIEHLRQDLATLERWQLQPME